MAQDAQHPPHNRPHPADERITRRLRLFFGLITCLIIPTVLALLALLIWYLVAVRQAEDLECDQPLKAYAYCALVIFVYSLHHRTIKKLLFSYDRDRDGPRRPSTVQLYDRIYQLVSLCYAITGICWVADSDTCQVSEARERADERRRGTPYERRGTRYERRQRQGESLSKGAASRAKRAEAAEN